MPSSRPDEMEELWHSTGLERVEIGQLEAGADYEGFDDLWHPFVPGSAAWAASHAALDDAGRATTVNVTANPKSDLAKAVRNVTDDQAFTATGPTSTTADPGETLQYRLTYRHTGALLGRACPAEGLA